MNGKNSISFARRLVVFLLLSSVLTSCQLQKSGETVFSDSEFPLLEIDIMSLQEGYKAGKYTVVEVVQLYIDRIRQIDQSGPKLNSIIHLNSDALQQAAILDQELKAGEWRGNMHGVPVLLKDNIDTKDGMPCTAGSKALAKHLPNKDAYLVKKLRVSGAVILGKTNMSEWANFRGSMSTSGWSSLGGQTKNPYFLDRNPCGSSSGSGVAVSANLTLVAIGTETNGSIVCPSHANGVVGIKPTAGMVSNSGIIPISFHMDVAGPMTRTVRDAAIALEAMTGRKAVDYVAYLDENALMGKRIGYYTGARGRNFKVDSLMNRALDFMEQAGAEIVELGEIIAPETAQAAFQVMLYEYRFGLNDYLANTVDHTGISNIQELIDFNQNEEYVLRYFNQLYLEMAAEKGDLDSEEYIESLAMMHFNSREEGIDRVMADFQLDAIVAPTGSPAWITDLYNGDNFQFGTSSPAAYAGYPIISIPMGEIHGLPVGISIFGPAWSEGTLLAIAYAFEQGTQHRFTPSFFAGAGDWGGKGIGGVRQD